MRWPKLRRPTTDLFHDGEVLNSIDLHRHGAFREPLFFPFRKLTTYPDRVELRWPNKAKPAQIIPVVWSRLDGINQDRPFFECYRCGRRCVLLFTNSIDVLCRKCAGLQFKSQRQTWKARLIAKAEKIRRRISKKNGKLTRPYYMHRATYRQHLNALQAIERAIRTRSRLSSARYRRYRERDEYGQYCD